MRALDKAAVFIDGGSLNWGAKMLLPQRVGIDLEHLSDALCDIVKADRWRTYYYTSSFSNDMMMTRGEKSILAEQQLFLHNLVKIPRFQVRVGRLVRRGSRLVETLTDVLLSIDLVRSSFNREIQKAILVSGDGDFAAAINAAKEAGVLTVVSFFRQWTSRELLSRCDQYIEMSDEFLDALPKKTTSSETTTYSDAISLEGSLKMFQELLGFEKEIRNFIMNKLQRASSASFTATDIPEVISKSWQKRKEDDIRVGRRPEANLIDYADFSDYKQIILHNWNVFSNLKDKYKVGVYLDDLNNLCRKPTMHMRTITEDEIGMGKTIIRWFKSKMREARAI